MVRRSSATRPTQLSRPGMMGLTARNALSSAVMLWAAATRRPSPSARKISARSASHSRTAFSASVSNTGCRSKDDCPITLSSSLVAVCCSSATRSSVLRVSSSVNSRTFSMAMTAWSAKVWRRATCRSLNNRADRDTFAHQRDVERGAMTHESRVLAALWKLALFDLHVDDVNSPSVEHGSAIGGAAHQWDGRLNGDRPVVGDQPQEVSVSPKDVRVERVAQACGATRHRVEHWLDVGRRARDDAKDVARRRLLLERLGEVGVLRLQLGEQARILDGDGRLVGEGLHQRDLAVGERKHLVPPDEDDAQQLVRPQHGNRQQRPQRQLSGQIGELGIGQNVMDMDGPPLEGGASRGASTIELDRILRDHRSIVAGKVADDHGSKESTIVAEDHRLLRLA